MGYLDQTWFEKSFSKFLVNILSEFFSQKLRGKEKMSDSFKTKILKEPYNIPIPLEILNLYEKEKHQPR